MAASDRAAVARYLATKQRLQRRLSVTERNPRPNLRLQYVARKVRAHLF
jgi:hypothetical protein